MALGTYPDLSIYSQVERRRLQIPFLDMGFGTRVLYLGSIYEYVDTVGSMSRKIDRYGDRKTDS